MDCRLPSMPSYFRYFNSRVKGDIKGKLSWIGDGANNMSYSFIEAAVKFQFNQK